MTADCYHARDRYSILAAMRPRSTFALVLALVIGPSFHGEAFHGEAFHGEAFWSEARAAEPWTAQVFFGPKAPRPAPAQATSAADVETAEQLYAKLEFDEANKFAERVVKLRGLTHDQLVRAYKILAITHGFVDHADQAREAFILLLTYEPDYQADTNLGPKVTTPFFEARGFWRSQPTKPSIETTASIRAQETGALRVTTRDPTRVVRRVTVGYRWTSSGDYSTTSIGVGNGMSVDIPTPPRGRTRLEYYAQALDDNDNVVLETGNPAAPKTAIVDTQGITLGRGGDGERNGSESGGSSILASPVFWAVAGVVIIGGATTAILALRPREIEPPTQATLTPTVQCGPTRCN